MVVISVKYSRSEAFNVTFKNMEFGELNPNSVID